MKCNVCGNEALFLEEFAPYIDKEWRFLVYDCPTCGCRFAARGAGGNYHEEIHAAQDSPYAFHYAKAQAVKNLLGDSQKCGAMLSKTPTLKKLFERLPLLRKEAHILEIGCSSGYVTAYLQSIGYKNALGIDISESAIAYAKECFGDYYAQKEPQGARYDCIFHTGLIGCVDDPMEFLAHYLGLLSKGGVMLFNAPNVESVRELGELWCDTPPPDLITLFDAKIFESRFGKEYTLECEAHASEYFIYEKSKAKILGKKYYRYPTRFYKESTPQKPKSASQKKLDKIKYKIVALLANIGVMRRYKDEYGLVVEMTK